MDEDAVVSSLQGSSAQNATHWMLTHTSAKTSTTLSLLLNTSLQLILAFF
jgi:hypothetical protein